LAKVTLGSVRRIVNSLPEAVEQDHHGIPSFRIKGRIFATLWDPSRLNIMLSPVRIVELVEENPQFCREIWWGRRLSCVQLDLLLSRIQLVEALLTEAYIYKKAPRKKQKSERGIQTRND
jgi:YjbR